MNLYLAGPFFSPAQINRIEKVEATLEQNPTATTVYSPRKGDDGVTESEGTPAWAKQVFNKDVAEIDKADALVVLADYEADNMDSGTAFEVGYAYSKHKPLIVLQELNAPLNLMIGQALHYYTKDVNDLATYDFSTLPANEYTGKTF